MLLKKLALRLILQLEYSNLKQIDETSGKKVFVKDIRNSDVIHEN